MCAITVNAGVNDKGVYHRELLVDARLLYGFTVSGCCTADTGALYPFDPSLPQD